MHNKEHQDCKGSYHSRSSKHSCSIQAAGRNFKHKVTWTIYAVASYYVLLRLRVHLTILNTLEELRNGLLHSYILNSKSEYCVKVVEIVDPFKQHIAMLGAPFPGMYKG